MRNADQHVSELERQRPDEGKRQRIAEGRPQRRGHHVARKHVGQIANARMK
jgi:hypothetical protein